jgi:nucleoside-diphosphate-sugar epimerase
VLGGTGQIGWAVAARLVEAGWDVTVGSRGTRPAPEGIRHIRVDRSEGLAVVDGADLLVDVIAFTAGDALQALGRDVGAIVAISSASVYADGAGRTLDGATGAEEFPRLPVPIPETQRTVDPGGATYSTRKVAMERVLLEQDRIPATVVRPCAIHGPHASSLREWYFVKRALDRRSRVILPYVGESVFHTTSVPNLAELVRLAAERPGTRVLNCGDPQPPSVLAICRAVGAALGWSPGLVLLPGPPEGSIGDTPWSTPLPLEIDMRAAESDLGYRPIVTYAEAVRETVAWLVEATRDRDWREVMPTGAQRMAESFDYAAEDAFLASRV